MTDATFLRPREFYKRSINPVQQYVEQNSFYLQRMSGRSESSCRNFIIDSLCTKKYESVKDPIVDYYERNDFGDREVFAISLTKYLKDVVSKGQILAPTFTTYKPITEEVSIIADFTEGNVNRRSKVKHEGQLAESKGMMELARAKDNEQANMKTYVNSLSGALGSDGSVLCNETGHNTLTSITRTMTSIGNALNERMIAGNRHYRNPDVTLDNLIYVAQSANYTELHDCMTRYGLYTPSVEDVMVMVKRSTDLYWNDQRYMQEIREFVEKLLPIERAAVMYTQDLYHLRIHNESFMRELITRFADADRKYDMTDPVAYMKKADPMIANYAHQVIVDKLAGKSKDYTEIEPEIVYQLACICKNIEDNVKFYKPLINAFLLTKALPSGTAYIGHMVRKAVVLSDTDSTMFSVDEWVTWYYGKLTFTPQAFATGGAVMFFATQSIAHCLAAFSANMGVADKHLFTLAMKPEFVFPVFAMTSVAKHYYTFKLVKEGMVYAVPDPEIKGVHLKNSAAPPSLVARGHEKMISILKAVMNEELIDLHKEVTFVADLEREITASLLAGGVEYFKKSRVKQHTAYTKGPTESPFQHHSFWLEGFASTYGTIQTPPYAVIKVPTTMTTPTATKAWLESIKNPVIKEGVTSWMVKHRKNKLPTVYLNVDYIKAYGIPPEIVPIVNTKKILLDLTGLFRMVLDSLGFGVKAGWLITELGY